MSDNELLAGDLAGRMELDALFLGQFNGAGAATNQVARESESVADSDFAASATPTATPKVPGGREGEWAGAGPSAPLGRMLGMQAADAERPAAPLPEEADDIHRAAVDVFARHGVAIRRDDDVYALMEFMYLSYTRLEARFAAERRLAASESASALRELVREAQTVTESTMIRLSHMNAEIEKSQRVAISGAVEATNRIIQAGGRQFEGFQAQAIKNAEAVFTSSLASAVTNQVERSLADAMRTAGQKQAQQFDEALGKIRAERAPGGIKSELLSLSVEVKVLAVAVALGALMLGRIL